MKLKALLFSSLLLVLLGLVFYQCQKEESSVPNEPKNTNEERATNDKVDFLVQLTKKGANANLLDNNLSKQISEKVKKLSPEERLNYFIEVGRFKLTKDIEKGRNIRQAKLYLNNFSGLEYLIREYEKYCIETYGKLSLELDWITQDRAERDYGLKYKLESLYKKNNIPLTPELLLSSPCEDLDPTSPTDCPLDTDFGLIDDTEAIGGVRIIGNGCIKNQVIDDDCDVLYIYSDEYGAGECGPADKCEFFWRADNFIMRTTINALGGQLSFRVTEGIDPELLYEVVIGGGYFGFPTFLCDDDFREDLRIVRNCPVKAPPQAEL